MDDFVKENFRERTKSNELEVEATIHKIQNKTDYSPFS